MILVRGDLYLLIVKLLPFVLISAHAPISAHPGHFRKNTFIRAHCSTSILDFTQFLHKHTVLTSLKLNLKWSITILKRLDHLSGIIIDYFDMPI